MKERVSEAATEVATSILIDGSWRTSETHREVSNPATGDVTSLQASADEGETREALDAASAALSGWRRTSAFERAEMLDKAAALLTERAEGIGQILAEETGKLKGEAVGEVLFAADYFSWFAGEVRRLEQLVAVEGRQNGPQIVLKKPVGVVASLTPWNFPVSIQARKVAPALAAGCTVVARPSEEAPGCVVELFRCLEEAGLPDGTVNLLTGSAGTITGPILEDHRVRLVSFTGSTSVGKMLYEKSARTMKRLALELGGSAPFVVCADADLEHTVEQAVLAKFRNCGQSCVAANCFYVEDGIYEDFVAGFAERIAALRLGDPLREDTTAGPVINVERRRSLEQFREQATAEGFESVASAPRLSDDSELSPDCFFAPTLLATRSFEEIDPSFLYGEVFGPIATVVGFSDLSSLLPHLTRNPLGLAGYVFSQDVPKAMRIAAGLEMGIVGVNEGLASAANVPMGGVKDSGLGREGGHLGLEEFLETQYLALRGSLPYLPDGSSGK